MPKRLLAIVAASIALGGFGAVLVLNQAGAASVTSSIVPITPCRLVDTRPAPDHVGALRAQLHLLNHAVSTSGVAALQESVVRGSQIYACTQQSDGSFAFTQHDVEARLGGGIHHTFVQPDAGPPQWQAPDGSAVTGTVATRNTNGDGNIAELNLDATQIGTSTGLLGHVVEVLRLNTVGGVAPAGTCDPQVTPIASVPYQADYVFING
jgi:hypothetical protein